MSESLATTKTRNKFIQFFQKKNTCRRLIRLRNQNDGNVNDQVKDVEDNDTKDSNILLGAFDEEPKTSQSERTSSLNWK